MAMATNMTRSRLTKSLTQSRRLGLLFASGISRRSPKRPHSNVVYVRTATTTLHHSISTHASSLSSFAEPELSYSRLRPLSIRSTSTSSNDVSSPQQASISNSSSSSSNIGCRLPSNFLPNLRRRHPNLSISTNHYDLDSHGHGESYHPTSPPDAVIYPSNVEEIQDIIRLCCREKENEGGEDEDDDDDDDDIASMSKRRHAIVGDNATTAY
mmetsp:Transcript_19039/g.35518  ORF Transcript_19039/g.35518 Transcript_19039/m.35518 type:complete len:212 (+) Transcript_19039:206-841(+)